MDGGSQDETTAILQEYHDPRLTWRSEKDNGQTDAINKGMRRATGDILAYLNSDDIYLPGMLRLVAEFFATQPDVQVVYGHCRSLDGEGNEIQPPLKADPFHPTKPFLISRWHIWQPAVFWRRGVMERIGLFDETLHYVMDYDYWLRMIVGGYTPYYVDRYLAGFRFHSESKSVSQSLKFYEEAEQVYAKIYSTPNLPSSIAALRSLSNAYLDFYQAAAFWKLGQCHEARPHLRKIIAGGAPFRLKVMAFTMMIDSYLHTSLHKGLQRVYWRLIGVQEPTDISINQFRAKDS
jgi:glycosyltransferase involved in cell wall biosynthesis